MPGREFSSGGYRYGFGGQEEDNEINNLKGSYNSAMFWEYDTRLGRRWNIDPKSPAWESGYAGYRNNPVVFIDPKGDDPFTAIIEGVTAYGIEAGLEFLTNMLVKGMDASTALEKVNWDAAEFEGIKATAISALLPPGSQTAARLAKLGKSAIGKITIKFIEELTSETMKNVYVGKYNDEKGNFQLEKLQQDFMNLVFTAGIST